MTQEELSDILSFYACGDLNSLTFVQGEYNDASPCEPADLPQTRLEPILVKYAAQNGFTVRFDTRLLSFVQDTETGIVESVIEDLVMKNKTLIRSRYLCGADGANSAIVRELQLPLQDNGVQGLALNVLIEADMVSAKAMFLRKRHVDFQRAVV